MTVYYLFDEAARARRNASGEQVWYCYITDILDKLGVRGRRLLPEELAQATLTGTDILFLGPDEPDAAGKAAIAAGLRRGCTAVAFATSGVEEMFGIRTLNAIAQPDGCFSLNGYFTVAEEWRETYLPVPDGGAALPVFAAVRELQAERAQELARLETGGRTVCGLTRAADADAYYFAFDLTHSIWASQQGAPGTEGEQPWARRIADMRILPREYNTRIAYNDYYVYILQSVLARKGLPTLHRLPPMKDGSAPDFLLFYQGDEDAAPGTERASEIMYRRGLPYQINIMPDPESGRYVMTKAEYDAVKARGHGIGVHQFLLSGWADFTQEGFRYHSDLFAETFGERPFSGLPHAGVVSGWAEIARYQAAAGLKAQNMWSAEVTPPDDINAFNLYGHSFGTAFPFFFHDDAAHQNRRIGLIALPTAYYEPRIGKGYEDGRQKIHDYLDDSAFFGRTSVLFFHPHYLAPEFGYDVQLSYAALDEVERYCREKRYTSCRYTADELTTWWHERAASGISRIETDADRTAFTVTVAGYTGMIAKLPLAGREHPAGVTVDGHETYSCVKTIDGLRWLLIPVTESGDHAVEVMYPQ